MTPAKNQADQGVGAERYLRKSLQRSSFPVFGFLAGWNWHLGAPKDDRARKKVPKASTFQDQVLTTCDTLPGNRKAKWKSPV